MGWLKPFSLFIFLRWRKTERKWSLLIKFSFKIYASIERYGSYKFFIFFLKFYLILGTSWQNLIACWLGSHMAWQRLRGPTWYPHPWISKPMITGTMGKLGCQNSLKGTNCKKLGGEGREKENMKREMRGGKREREQEREQERTKRGGKRERRQREGVGRRGRETCWPMMWC